MPREGTKTFLCLNSFHKRPNFEIRYAPGGDENLIHQAELLTYYVEIRYAPGGDENICGLTVTSAS